MDPETIQERGWIIVKWEMFSRETERERARERLWEWFMVLFEFLEKKNKKKRQEYTTTNKIR